MRDHVVVTGGAGFIGSHVVDKLLANGYTVSVVDDLSTGRETNLPEEVRLLRKDVRQIVREDVADAKIVIHCAAQVSTFKSVDYPEDDFSRNAEGTFRILEVLRKHNPNVLFIYTSSRSVHGNIPPPQVADENYPFSPSTFYNVHKIYGEMLCQIYHALYGLKYVVLRPANVYGVRQPYWVGGWYNFIAHWFKIALEKGKIPIYGTGEQVRDYIYVDDVANAYVKACEIDHAVGQTFLLATGVGTTLNQLAQKIIQITDNDVGVEYLPPRKGDIERFVGSFEKTSKILGVRPQTSLDEGLRREYKWIKKELAK